MSVCLYLYVPLRASLPHVCLCVGGVSCTSHPSICVALATCHWDAREQGVFVLLVMTLAVHMDSGWSGRLDVSVRLMVIVVGRV